MPICGVFFVPRFPRARAPPRRVVARSLAVANRVSTPHFMPRRPRAEFEAEASAAATPKRLPGASYWRRLAPGLHVKDEEYIAGVLSHEIALKPAVIEQCKAQLIQDGFFTLPPEALPWANISLKAMRVGVKRLQRRGWPATLLLAYDEVWALAHQLSHLMAAVSGGCVNSLDMLAWSVTPALGQSGFAPHRDRQPADVGRSFREDGTARYTTAWIALSEATPENSCLYLVPRQHDPGYDEGDDQSPDAEDPLIRVLRSDAAVQAMRACPLRPGGAVFFTHRAMHWGSKGQLQCTTPRVSVSFGHSDPTFEPPFFSTAGHSLPFPKLSLRCALAAAQLINYHERFEFGLPMLRRFGATYRAHLDDFSPEYAEKTAAEFMAACHDRKRRQKAGGAADEAPPAAASAPKMRKKAPKSTGIKAQGAERLDPRPRVVGGVDDEDDDDDDAALDDALDAMLDAQGKAAHNLYDDFDDWA